MIEFPFHEGRWVILCISPLDMKRKTERTNPSEITYTQERPASKTLN